MDSGLRVTEANIGLLIFFMAKRVVDGGNAHTCFVPACPAAKAARKQVAAASPASCRHRSTVYHLRKVEELADKGTFWKIAKAIEHRDRLLSSGEWTPAELGLFAEEVSDRGARRFFINTYQGFSMDMAEREAGSNFYEVIQEGHPCWLYFDLEFSKTANPQLDADEVAMQFSRALTDFCAKEGVQYDECRTVVLDSSTEAKFSKHVIVKSLAFKDNIQAGGFVNMFVEYTGVLRQEPGFGTDLLFVRGDPEDAEATKSVVDTSVCTRNRNFRVLRQSKRGKNTPLKLQDGGVVVHESDSVDRQVLRTLVSFVPNGTKVLPADSRYEPKAVRRRAASISVGVADIPDELRRVTSWMVEAWDKMRAKKENCTWPPTTIGNIWMPQNGSGMFFTVTLCNNRFCVARGRSHRSNNVYLKVDLHRGEFEQRCFDREDCPWRPYHERFIFPISPELGARHERQLPRHLELFDGLPEQ